MTERIKMLSVAGLKERGWTASMISTLLGDPDEIRKNPHYAKSAPMRLYSEARAESLEASSEFAAAKAKSATRSGNAKKAAEIRRESLLSQVKDMKVWVRTMPVDLVRKRAIEAYNEWNCDCVSSDAVPSFLDRITVNYIRHNLTFYDEALEEVSGRVGVADAVRIIRRKIFEAIAFHYPLLAPECERQMMVKELCDAG